MAVGFYVHDFGDPLLAVVHRDRGHAVVAVDVHMGPRQRVQAALDLLTDEEIASWLPGRNVD